MRRAAKSFVKAQSFDEIGKALQAAFHASDFDGYQLDIASGAASLAGQSSSAQIIAWNKEGAGANPRWALHLELITTRNQKVGNFSLYREYSARPLLIDVNLLIVNFQMALADAVDRAAGLTAPYDEKIKLSADRGLRNESVARP